MSVSDVARKRGIVEILHYTSDKGVLGTVVKDALLSRERVESDPEIAYIFRGIWDIKEPDWADHISLSLSQVNIDLFKRARTKHPDRWWAVMSFDIELLDHPGVHFATTNNSYPVCQRGEGVDGFEALFGRSIAWGRHGSVTHRRTDCDHALPTHYAAEVLYPGEIPIEHLRAVYVESPQQQHMIKAWCDAYGKPHLPVEINIEHLA
jgi:hypothetical protein